MRGQAPSKRERLSRTQCRFGSAKSGCRVEHVERLYRLVLKIALRIVRDPGEAEDVMQDVFFEIFNKAAQFDRAKGGAKTWILQYAYHRSLSRRQYLALRSFYDRHQIGEREVSESNSVDASWRGRGFHECGRGFYVG